jgi:hypothetical protein
VDDLVSVALGIALELKMIPGELMGRTSAITAPKFSGRSALRSTD